MKKEDLDRIKAVILGEFFYYETIDSTNSAALLHTDAKDKSLFVAENQTSGRGRQNRSWEASSGGIYMTILLKPKTISEDISALTLAVGLAVARAVPESLIKWPNDIILDDKKVAGILLETRIEKNSGVIAAGIGINANNTAFSDDLQEKATSMHIHFGKMQDIAGIIVKVYTEVIKIYEDFISGGFAKIKNEYVKKCVTLKREIVILQDGEERVMRAKDIGKRGELLAEADGKTEAIAFGEVSVRGLLGYTK